MAVGGAFNSAIWRRSARLSKIDLAIHWTCRSNVFDRLAHPGSGAFIRSHFYNGPSAVYERLIPPSNKKEDRVGKISL